MDFFHEASKSTCGGKFYKQGGTPYGKSHWDELCSHFRNKRKYFGKIFKETPHDKHGRDKYAHFDKQLKRRLRENLNNTKNAEAAVANEKHKATRNARCHYHEAMKPFARLEATPNIVLAVHCGVLHIAHADVSEIPVCHFEKLHSKTESDDFDDSHLAFAEYENECVEDNFHNLETDRDISPKDVESVLKNLPNHRCAGSDLQPYELYKYSGRDGAKVIWRLLQRLLREGKSLSQYHTNNIILVLPKDGDPTLMEHKHGIGIGLPALRKIYSRIINNRLLAKLKVIEAFFPRQDRFIRGYDVSLLTLVETFSSRKQAGRTTFSLFLDFRKAFDTVCHTSLWRRLWEVGVRGHLLHVIKELYADLQTCVLVNGQKSYNFNIQEGVLQGDVLSTTLFIVYVDSLLKDIQKLGKSVSIFVDGHEVDSMSITDLACADDVTVVTETAEEMRMVLRTIEKWSVTWMMQVNAKKTEIMVVGRYDEKNLIFSYDGELTRIFQSTKYLGVIFNNNLTWTTA